jgi:hypothetical protein
MIPFQMFVDQLLGFQVLACAKVIIVSHISLPCTKPQAYSYHRKTGIQRLLFRSYVSDASAP